MLDGLKAIGMFIKNLFTDANTNLRQVKKETWTCGICHRTFSSRWRLAIHELHYCGPKHEQPKK
jgi:hypothetical protein